MPHNIKRIDRATHALIAYELDAFPGKPSLLQRDPFYSEALLAALVCDLEHYANHHGINFSGIVSTGRALNAEEVSEDAPYKPGDHVCLTRQHDYCGTVIGWQTTGTDEETSYLVAVPGIPYIYAEVATHLAPAPAFPPTETILGTVHSADQAEQLYFNIVKQLPNAPASTRPKLEHDRQRLLDALSSWSGISVSRLHNELAPRPATARRPEIDVHAAAEIQTDVSHSFAAEPPATPRRRRPPPSPRGTITNT
ncbi:hypothetical protein AB0C84_20635 [Actinomadura sp. NPDC048955]|uniref:hypothetical protein n=1 Tax=Actinomadura sp. NPDC048955 TaxID=3158228 RepID=UPI0033DE5587